MSQDKKIVVLGGGSFGTAVANMMASNGHSVVLWMRNREHAESCQRDRVNRYYLPDYTLDDHLFITSDLASALDGAELVFFSIPSAAFRQVAKDAAPFIQPGCVVISTAKGIEAATFTLMSDILKQELNQPRVGVISGPNLAREVVNQEITATVIASADPGVCELVQTLLTTPYFRVYSNPDVYGVELAGALKNIYAIEAGMATAMGLGQNTMSVLITRSLAEMTRFAAVLGADPMTFLGLSGVGDLFVTCTSPLSRNFRIGQALAKGLTIAEAAEEIGQVAEGVNTTRIVKEKADELGVYMPLASGLYGVMFEGKSIARVLHNMMLSEKIDDVEFRVK
ncbi:MAG: NAD(P)H-dependent glycerol-3-phosphate dehydrogenase [Porticoccaceae bacterium]|nr:NAD(P)H-dependent glycerol-3-phosphate dehydrogenase [Porticoccaceae bacterium]